MQQLHLLIFLSFIRSTSEESAIPKGCRDTKCVIEHEWINEDDPYTPGHLNDSGMCLHDGIKSQLDVDFSTACFQSINVRYNATKLLVLRQIEHEYDMMCNDAEAGCSLKRRLKAMVSSTLFWRHCLDKEIEYHVARGNALNIMWAFNNNYQPTVIAPMFFICHSINIVVLKKMLVDDKTAIVFQLAEVISDMSSCLFSSLFSGCLHVLLAYCTRVDVYRTLYTNATYEQGTVFPGGGFGHWYYLDRHPTWEIMLNAVSGFQIANQLFNLYLLISRWYCITHGMKYMKMSKSKKTALTVILITVAVCVLVAFWPAPTIHVKDYKGRDWHYMWHMYPMFKGSGLFKLLVETKGSFVTVSYLGLIVAQMVFAVLMYSKFRAYMRSDSLMANETEAQAAERKAQEKDKASLMASTLVVNWICMTPTLMIMYAKALGIDWGTELALLGGAKVLRLLQGLQLVASGFNAIGVFGAHLMFTKSYRRAFHAVFIARFGNGSNQVGGH